MTKADKRGVEELVKEYQPQLKSFIRRRVASEEDAEDILQDVFYQLIKTMEIAIEPISQIGGWLYRVARNLIINKGKKSKEIEYPFYEDKESGVFVDFSDVLFNNNVSTPETEYLRSLIWKELEMALSELPLEQREVFEWTELEGIPVKEISKTVGVSVNTLLSRKHYAIKFLRKRLNDLYREIISY